MFKIKGISMNGDSLRQKNAEFVINHSAMSTGMVTARLVSFFKPTNPYFWSVLGVLMATGFGLQTGFYSNADLFVIKVLMCSSLLLGILATLIPEYKVSIIPYMLFTVLASYVSFPDPRLNAAEAIKLADSIEERSANNAIALSLRDFVNTDDAYGLAQYLLDNPFIQPASSDKEMLVRLIDLSQWTEPELMRQAVLSNGYLSEAEYWMLMSELETNLMGIQLLSEMASKMKI